MTKNVRNLYTLYQIGNGAFKKNSLRAINFYFHLIISINMNIYVQQVSNPKYPELSVQKNAWKGVDSNMLL